MRTLGMILLLGCGQAAYGASPTAYAGEADSGGQDEALPQAADVSTRGSATHSRQASLQTVVDDGASERPAEGRAPRLIYIAELGLVVDHGAVSATLDQLVAATLHQGGYLSRRNDRQLVVRIPSERFHPAFASFEEIGEVESRNVQVEDVSEEYHNLEVRIQSLTALLERMRGLLERTDTLDEILRIEAELERISAEIDRAQGRLRYLGSRVAWSTLTISVRERPAPTPDAEPPPPVPPSTRPLPIEWLNQTGLDALLRLEN